MRSIPASEQKPLLSLAKMALCFIYSYTFEMSLFVNFADIGANLTDEMYQGSYHGSKKHEPDLDVVLKRAWSGGMDKMIITGGSLEDSKKALDLARSDCKCSSVSLLAPPRG